ncbi:hypothetical protein BV22DRAFT_1133966 [Leucogyrophana mollusca]|uniref:Uncharacterized protein n=1 Tax=Leucogyrophana mollusca TaxID=85980 RepID=A0ACB8B170_9AGAM|nr:hypothetical protein BV22DRAFT_1133966 [Leucogyrophana mollusca]
MINGGFVIAVPPVLHRIFGPGFVTVTCGVQVLASTVFTTIRLDVGLPASDVEAQLRQAVGFTPILLAHSLRMLMVIQFGALEFEMELCEIRIALPVGDSPLDKEVSPFFSVQLPHLTRDAPFTIDGYKLSQNTRAGVSHTPSRIFRHAARPGPG